MADEFCYCENDDPASIYQERDVMQARKVMACSECDGAILPGESYKHIWGVWPTIGGAATYRKCARCMVLQEFVLAHIPCACLYLGMLHQSVYDELDNNSEAEVLKAEIEALIADTTAQPKARALLAGSGES